MVTTLTTSIEDYQNALGSDVAPDAYTLPTLLAIDGYRKIVFNLIKKITGISSSADDIDGIAAGYEKEIVSAKILAVSKGDQYYLTIPTEYKTDLQATFGDAIYAFVPNENG